MSGLTNNPPPLFHVVNTGMPELHLAIAKKDIDGVINLTQSGSDVNVRDPLSDDETALHYIAKDMKFICRAVAALGRVNTNCSRYGMLIYYRRWLERQGDQTGGTYQGPV